MNEAPTADGGPGFLAFLAFFLLALALWFLMRNMNARMRRMSYRQQAAHRGNDEPQATPEDLEAERDGLLPVPPGPTRRTGRRLVRRRRTTARAPRPATRADRRDGRPLATPRRRAPVGPVCGSLRRSRAR